jgi:uncharacterized protein (DUF362 family)
VLTSTISFLDNRFKLNTCLSSKGLNQLCNLVAADATAARCIGIDPYTIDQVQLLHEAGMGEITDIEVVGDGIDAVYQKWELDQE